MSGVADTTGTEPGEARGSSRRLARPRLSGGVHAGGAEGAGHGGGEIPETTVALTVLDGGISAERKYCASGCGAPSMVKPVMMAGTPAASRKLREVCQLKPCASGGDGHTVSGRRHDGRRTEAP